MIGVAAFVTKTSRWAWEIALGLAVGCRALLTSLEADTVEALP
jgi:hypothetical protein